MQDDELEAEYGPRIQAALAAPADEQAALLLAIVHAAYWDGERMGVSNALTE